MQVNNSHKFKCLFLLAFFLAQDPVHCLTLPCIDIPIYLYDIGMSFKYPIHNAIGQCFLMCHGLSVSLWSQVLIPNSNHNLLVASALSSNLVYLPA